MTETPTPGFWRRRIVDPLAAQLTQGVTPERLALACAVGAALGVFPILGSSTLLCLLAGIILKLNQPALQTVNYLVYPLQILLLPALVRLGEILFRADPVPFTPQGLIREFSQGIAPFLAKYGQAGLHGIAAWFLLAPAAAAMIYLALVPVFRKLERARKISG